MAPHSWIVGFTLQTQVATIADMKSETSHTTLGEHMHCCTVFNLPTHPKVCTDVPQKLGGLGEQPSPGELLAATVASCMLSNIAYTGTQKNFPTKGITISADITEGTQGVGELHFCISVPFSTSPQQRALIEAAVASCPVGQSIHPDIPKHIEWHWAE